MSLFEQILPDGYELVSDVMTENVTMVTYAGTNDVAAQLYITPAGGEVQLDTEDAVCTDIIVGAYKALLIEEPPAAWYFGRMRGIMLIIRCKPRFTMDYRLKCLENM